MGRGVPPCGAGSFLRGQKGTKDPLGAASGERLRAAGAHSHCPQTPITGDALLFSWALSSGVQNQDRLVLLAPGHWALPSEILKVYTLYGHRLLRQSRGSWAVIGTKYA